MNQAFGGAFLIKLALIFLSIYIVVLGFAMNYATVFTMKNKLINILEQYEGYNEHSELQMAEIVAQIDRLNYRGATTGRVESGCINSQYEEFYCIQEYSGGNRTKYYKVTAYIQFEIPMLDKIAAGVIHVTGETRNMYEFEM